MKKIVAIAVVAVIGGLLALLSASQNTYLNRPRFDGFDKKQLKKAYKSMLTDALKGKQHLVPDSGTEAEFDAELIARYHAMD